MAGHKHDHKNCLQIFKRLSEYLDDELDDQTRREIGSHLQECSRCHVCLETLRRTIELLKNTETGAIPERIEKELPGIDHPKAW